MWNVSRGVLVHSEGELLQLASTSRCFSPSFPSILSVSFGSCKIARLARLACRLRVHLSIRFKSSHLLTQGAEKQLWPEWCSQGTAVCLWIKMCVWGGQVCYICRHFINFFKFWDHIISVFWQKKKIFFFVWIDFINTYIFSASLDSLGNKEEFSLVVLPSVSLVLYWVKWLVW